MLTACLLAYNDRIAVEASHNSFQTVLRRASHARLVDEGVRPSSLMAAECLKVSLGSQCSTWKSVSE